MQWALTARYALLCDAYVDLVQEGELDEAGFEDKVLEPARQINPAKWWIDNRDATSSMVIELLADPGLDSHNTQNENPY
ncbi:hypothetical protein [Leucobacter luti]|uniref:hypothetical protein n=1 Tax=Leucobacter luti TaxID=340320 RepID=UPI0010457539|nr:hypothetical protein [Leucobacter luti]MCW2288999.1 hypothetical protein [Leucobacter luti]